MIRPLRIRHRRIFTVLGLMLPVAFGLGIAARKPVPQVNALPTELRPMGLQFSSVLWERHDLFTNAPVQVRLLREQHDTGKYGIACFAASDFVKPDLLLYWSSGAAPISDKLPSDSILLGTFSSPPLALPENMSKEGGVLVLFSLADQEVVAVSQQIRFNNQTK